MLKDHIFDEKESNIYVKTSVSECYLQHAAVLDDFTEERRTEALGKVGSVLNKLKRLRDLELKDAESDVDRIRELLMEALRSEIAEESDELPDAAFFNSLDLTCTPSAFFKVMVMCIKNNGLLLDIIN